MKAIPVGVLLLAMASPTLALGAGSCGSCFLPPELEEQGAMLEASFSDADPITLRRQRWAETLCSYHPCGGITEVQAKDLLDNLAEEARRAEDRWIDYAGVWISVIGALIAFAALVQALVSDRRSKTANERSLRNEAKIEAMDGAQSK